jgi:hypothetical protein
MVRALCDFGSFVVQLLMHADSDARGRYVCPRLTIGWPATSFRTVRSRPKPMSAGAILQVSTPALVPGGD